MSKLKSKISKVIRGVGEEISESCGTLKTPSKMATRRPASPSGGSSSSSPPSKRARSSSPPPSPAIPGKGGAQSNSAPCYILNMSDEILLFLVKKIPSCVDVFRLSETCTRMARDVGSVLDDEALARALFFEIL